MTQFLLRFGVLFLFGAFFLLTATACRRDAQVPEPGDKVGEAEPADKGGKVETIVFMTENYYFRRALIEKRLETVEFSTNGNPHDVSVRKFDVTDVRGDFEDSLKKNGFATPKPGAYTDYSIRGYEGRMKQLSISFRVEGALPTKESFKLSNIKQVGAVVMSGASVVGGSTRGENENPYDVFSASLDTGWRGKPLNRAQAKYPEIDRRSLDDKLVQADLATLRGTWKCIKVIEERELPADLLLTFDGHEITAKGGVFMHRLLSNGSEKLSFVIDPSKTPKEIDFERDDQSYTSHLGTYEVEKDRLTICVASYTEKARPKSVERFDKGNDPKQVFLHMVFTREK